jgi:anti-sigma-K factor RskA
MNEQHVDELLEAYALGALEPDEARAVEAHLAGCARCRALADAARETAAALAYAAPLFDPPASLRARVLARVHEVATEERALWPGRSESGGAPRRGRLLSILGRGRSENEPNDALAEEIKQLLANPESAVWEISGTPEAPAARARLIGIPSRGEAVLVTTGLQPLAPNRAYQVWFLQGGQPAPSTTFSTPSTGPARIRVRAPERIERFDTIAITPEPAGGSPAPTGPIVLVGQLTS